MGKLSLSESLAGCYAAPHCMVPYALRCTSYSCLSRASFRMYDVLLSHVHLYGQCSEKYLEDKCVPGGT